jgi:hypothetical protein
VGTPSTAASIDRPSAEAGVIAAIKPPWRPAREFFEREFYMEILNDPQQAVLIAFAIGFVLGMVTMKT